ncbi:hypothetical protein SAMD00023353_0102210 [Rosellinia necatrix]|uniref:Uncharacterized protein n=1 Tax=Rosellinia necatrix TaxID=77044 RepID=A0A1S7UHN9_ROSNE|nr:hypothetical protein SAMD00023353_0102210 [Rosellinia necatrix]
MTTEAAWFNASHQRGNVLVISQPGAVWVDNRVPTAFSQPFTVQSLIFKDYIQTQIEISRQTEYNKWRLGVSIGLGIGVPFLMFITTVGVLAISGMQARKQLDNEVEIFPNEPSIY